MIDATVMSVTDMDMNVNNKVVAITGASSGIGEATALLLAGRGAKVVLGARGEERLADLAGRIEAAGGEAAWTAVDVARREDVQRLVDLALERFGRLDVLVSNAGVMPIGPLDDLDVDAWERMVDVNVKGVLFGIAAALPVFRRQGTGHFVTTGSTAALRTVSTMAVYSGTKSAVRAISEGLRQEAGEHLRVTLVSPGFVRTNVVDHMTNPEVRAQIATATDQMAIPADAVARAIAYAIEQPEDVDVGEIVVRPTAQA
jgi:NADP-dependent 3-hydroxy acid dehydrogenase YdfG